MEIRLPEAEPAPPHRPYRAALRIYIIGILGFAFWSLLLNRAEMEGGTAPLIHVRGYPVGMAAVVESLELVFLLVMTVCFVALQRRWSTRSLKHTAEYTIKLKQEFRKLKKRELELEHAIADLERFNAMATGREQRIMELKDEVNALLQDLNQPKRYNSIPAE